MAKPIKPAVKNKAIKSTARANANALLKDQGKSTKTAAKDTKAADKSDKNWSQVAEGSSTNKRMQKQVQQSVKARGGNPPKSVVFSKKK
jgi:hypothetical protein